MNRNTLRDALIAALWLGGDLDVPGHCELVADIVLAMPEIQALLANEARDAEIERLRAENAEWKRRVMGNTPINITITQNTEIELLRAENERLRADVDECDQLREIMADILHRTADALHGGPLENGMWSWHDLPELAKEARRG